MANVQSTNSSGDVLFKYGANTKTDATKGESTTEEAQNRFLKLLVTQLRNQDPLNPLDNAQMTSQLAQMSTVSGIEKLNTTLTGLVDSFGNSQAMQASATQQSIATTQQKWEKAGVQMNFKPPGGI